MADHPVIASSNESGSQAVGHVQGAIEEIRHKLDYYSVTHSAQCAGGHDGYTGDSLIGCDCETGEAWRVIEQCVNGYADLLRQRDTLLDALKSLHNEAGGLLGLVEFSLRGLAGNTNVNCLDRRIEEARRAIADCEAK